MGMCAVSNAVFLWKWVNCGLVAWLTIHQLIVHVLDKLLLFCNNWCDCNSQNAEAAYVVLTDSQWKHSSASDFKSQPGNIRMTALWIYLFTVLSCTFFDHTERTILSMNKKKCTSRLDAHASTFEWNWWAAVALWVWRTTGQWRDYGQRVYSTFRSTYVYSRSISALRWCERPASTWVWRLQAPVVEREREWAWACFRSCCVSQRHDLPAAAAAAGAMIQRISSTPASQASQTTHGPCSDCSH